MTADRGPTFNPVCRSRTVGHRLPGLHRYQPMCVQLSTFIFASIGTLIVTVYQHCHYTYTHRRVILTIFNNPVNHVVIVTPGIILFLRMLYARSNKGNIKEQEPPHQRRQIQRHQNNSHQVKESNFQISGSYIR